MSYQECYEGYKRRVEDQLALSLDTCKAPEPLKSAMRYSALGVGKRLRGVLLLAAHAALGKKAPGKEILFASAIEMIHAYSLIHDDLPAMDDDDLRRGKPTNHKVYGEAMAILAGDGLLSYAFETLAEACETREEIQAMRAIARAAGVHGMVAGQSMDIDCEKHKKGAKDELSYIHLHKTADLFIGAVDAGLALAGAKEEQRRAGQAYATALGIAFQMQDDVLDVIGDSDVLGKETGMDQSLGKLTWPALYGLEATQQTIAQYSAEAAAALACFGEHANFLKETAAMLLERNH